MKTVDIAVIGSAHIDVLADFSAGGAKVKDKAGKVRFAIGGTAYNLAYNLAYHGNSVGLVVAGDKRSALFGIIKKKLKAARIPILRRLDVGAHAESAFVALRMDGELISAVSDCAIEQANISPEEASSIIGNAKLVAVDCNVSGELLSAVVEQAARKSIPVFVSAVSEPKVHRIDAVAGKGRIKLAAMSKSEAVAFFGLSAADFPKLMNRIAAKVPSTPIENLMVTNGKHGYALVDQHGTAHLFNAPKIAPVHSTHGAGDALFSACIEHYLKHEQLDGEELKACIHRYLAPVLGGDAATPSGDGFYDAGSLTKAHSSANPIWHIITAIATIIGATAAILALFL